MKIDRQVQGKLAEIEVVSELMRLGAVPYLPLTDIEGVDVIVTVKGSAPPLRLQIKARGFNNGSAPRRLFRVNRLEVADDFFVVCVEATGGEIGEKWVFPSKVFAAHAKLDSSGVRDLDLDSGIRKYGQPLHELLCGFKNRWELITEYESFIDLMSSPEDLEDVLTMKDALEGRDEEMLNLDEYERLRRVRI